MKRVFHITDENPKRFNINQINQKIVEKIQVCLDWITCRENQEVLLNSNVDTWQQHSDLSRERRIWGFIQQDMFQGITSVRIQDRSNFLYQNTFRESFNYQPKDPFEPFLNYNFYYNIIRHMQYDKEYLLQFQKQLRGDKEFFRHSWTPKEKEYITDYYITGWEIRGGSHNKLSADCFQFIYNNFDHDLNTFYRVTQNSRSELVLKQLIKIWIKEKKSNILLMLLNREDLKTSNCRECIDGLYSIYKKTKNETILRDLLKPLRFHSKQLYRLHTYKNLNKLGVLTLKDIRNLKLEDDKMAKRLLQKVRDDKRYSERIRKETSISYDLHLLDEYSNKQNDLEFMFQEY